jgi:hypothetical protein
MTTDKPLTDGQLASALTRSRRWIYDARARGAPAGTNLVEWQAWAEQNDTRKPHSAHGVSLKDRKTRQEIRKLRLQNDARDERLKDAWRQAGLEAMIAEANKLRIALHGLLPDRLATRLGTDAVVIRKELEACLNELLPAEKPHG